ncbi:MAG TPA: transposase [Chitinophagaceae bacterium]|nr:transposase [Chitinophagaceae bacterium]
MSTYTQILYQIVFSTRFREPTMIPVGREQLYQYIGGVLKNKNCHPYQVGGFSDHLHIITSLHPSISLADLIKDIKLSTTKHIKENRVFPYFNGWQDGYGAFTYGLDALDNLVRYVKNQEEHHKKKGSMDEYLELLQSHNIQYDLKYLI